MADVPLALTDLQNITEVVARNLLEQWAINDRFTEDQLDEATKNAVDDVVFVMNSFMELFNQKMLLQSQESNTNSLII